MAFTAIIGKRTADVTAIATRGRVFTPSVPAPSCPWLAAACRPTGAARLYLAVMDEKGWWRDNFGQIGTTILDNKIQLVRQKIRNQKSESSPNDE